MKKSIKRLLILTLIIMVMLPYFSTIVLANYSFTASMTAKNSKVTAGSEVLITVKLSNLNVGENGINSFSAYLSYDSEVFETLTDSSVDGCNGWVPSYTTGTGKITLYRPTFLKSDEEIMQISLKTKSDLEDGTQGDVKLSTIIVSNSSDEIMSSPVSTTITIGSSTSPDSINSTPANKISPIIINTPVNNAVPAPIEVKNETVNNTIEVVNDTTNTQNQIEVITESENDMPYTGSDSGALARIIIGIIFIGLVMYLKIEKLNKDIR